MICDTPAGPTHWTYCLNVHPGESWAENFQAIRTHALAVRERVCAGERFGLGLRLGATAADELADPAATEAFRTFLDEHDLYVFTINGFPYGPFHGQAVKERVYAPDWRDRARRDYTRRLAEILARLAPADVSGTISTVPAGYAPAMTDADAAHQAAHYLADVAMFLDGLHRRTGRTVRLALEPEPDCLLEDAASAIAFFTGPLREVGREFLKLNDGLDAAAADALLARHVGVCVDAAHAAVAFEDPADAIDRLGRAGVGVFKVHVSAAIACEPTAAARTRLAEFADEVYLHQVSALRGDGAVQRWPDLPAALADPSLAGAREMRVHFHVPLYWPGGEQLGTTRGELTGRLGELARAGAVDQWEVETYTFSVMPGDLAAADLPGAIARELEWARANVAGQTGDGAEGKWV